MTRAWILWPLALAAALPTGAAAVEWTARTGLGYTKEDRARPGLPTQSTPRLDVDLSLDLKGFVDDPDSLAWSGGVGYRRLSVGGAQDSAENSVVYRLRANAFSSRTSPLALSAFAMRTEGDGSAGAVTTGSTSHSFGATAGIRVPGAIPIELGYTRTESEYSGSFYARSRTTRDNVSASTGTSGSLFSFSTAYRGTFSDGTYASENFDEHRVNVTTRVRVGAGATLDVTDGFYRRDPTGDLALNPRQAQNLFGANLRLEGPPGSGQLQRLQYQHTSALSETPDLTEARAVQELSYALERPVVGRTWFLQGRASVSLDERTHAATREQYAGQALGSTLSYRIQEEGRAVELHAGPTIGLTEAWPGSTDFGWGAAAGGSYQRMLPYMTWTAQYGIGYTTALVGAGTTLSQQASITADGRAGPGHLRGSVNANASRTNDDLFGARASRSLVARGEYALRLSSAWVDVTISDGLAAPLRTTISGDGLLLGPGYDVHSRSVTAGTRGRLGALHALTSIRLAASDAPDRPVQNDLELRAEFGVRRGAFVLSLEDRYLVALDKHDGRGSVNVFLLRISRVFGSEG